MKDLFLSLALVALARVHAQLNDTMAPTGQPTMEPTPAVTSIYTSDVILSTQSALNDSNFTDPRDYGCDFEFLQTLDNGEGITFDLCGFTNDAGVRMVDIEVMLPSDRWFGVGFSTIADFDESDPMNGVYAVVVQQNSRDISERSLGSGNAGEKLTSTIMVAEDSSENAMRTLRVQRELRTDLNELEQPSDFSKYFNFENFDACDEPIQVIWGYATLANAPFVVDADWFDSDNSGSETILMMEVDEESCFSDEDESDGAVETSLAVLATVVVAGLGAMW